MGICAAGLALPVMSDLVHTKKERNTLPATNNTLSATKLKFSEPFFVHRSFVHVHSACTL
jgi:hypothetical protein